jgi:hypothetical protein
MNQEKAQRFRGFTSYLLKERRDCYGKLKGFFSLNK